MSGLTIRGLSLSYKGSPRVSALCEVDLDVEPGTIVAVLGPSGCGKTTLLRAIAGLERARAGRIEMDDTVFDDDDAGIHLAPERRGIGLVPQDGALFPHLDVTRNVSFGLRRWSRADKDRRVTELLAMVDLAGYGDRRPAALSGGQQQRVALARALAPHPSMVLLDEPFSALDSGLRAEVRAEVTRLLRAVGSTALIVTHDQAEALEMADVVAVMRAGRIEQIGPPAEVYHHPVNVWVGRFIGEAITVPGTVRGDVVACALGTLPLAVPAEDGPTTVFLRPEQLLPVPEGQQSGGREAGGGGSGGRESGAPVRAKVRDVRFRGYEAAVDLDLDELAITARWPSNHLPEVGTEVAIAVDGPALALPD